MGGCENLAAPQKKWSTTQAWNTAGAKRAAVFWQPWSCSSVRPSPPPPPPSSTCTKPARAPAPAHARRHMVKLGGIHLDPWDPEADDDEVLGPRGARVKPTPPARPDTTAIYFHVFYAIECSQNAGAINEHTQPASVSVLEADEGRQP